MCFISGIIVIQTLMKYLLNLIFKFFKYFFQVRHIAIINTFI